MKRTPDRSSPALLAAALAVPGACAEEIRPRRLPTPRSRSATPSLQRPGLGLRHDRQGRSPPISRWSTSRAASTAARSTSSPTTTATARRRPSSRRASWSSRTRCCSLFQTLGTPSNTAIHKYMNAKKVPQLLRRHRRHQVERPEELPVDHGLAAELPDRGQIYAKHCSRPSPNAKIAILYQNDDYGKDYLKGLKDGLGDKAKR